MLNYEIIESYKELDEINKEIFRKYFLDVTSDDELIDIINSLSNWDDLQSEIFILLIDEWYNDALKVFDIIEDNNYIVWHDCNNMGDVAYEVVHEYYYDMFDTDNILTRYFDYEGFGRDLEIEGNFFEFNNGYIEIIA